MMQLAEDQLCNDLRGCVSVLCKILEDNNLNSSTSVKEVSPYLYIGFSDGRKRTVRFESEKPFHYKLRVNLKNGIITKKGHTNPLGHIFRVSYDDIVRLSAHVT